MSARFDLVTIDAADAARLVTFWSRALGLAPSESEDDGRWTVLSDAAGTRRIGVQRIVGLAPSAAIWEGSQKQRTHMDLQCETMEFDNEVHRLIKLGAARIRPDRIEAYGSIATLADPEGNVFDLCAYL
jgi:predicted enzyme related to lactoylglutathione lyase